MLANPTTTTSSSSSPSSLLASKLSSTTTKGSNNNAVKRGAFIVFEGVDRCGKTTQVGLLVKHLIKLGLAAVAMRFPDRTTSVGMLINQYLQSKSELDDRAIHLLFSANRWEVSPTLKNHLLSGTNVVCDRYAYSGVAFSSSKASLSDELSWCQSCDVGLPAPDAVIFMDLSQEEAEKRGGFGNERYEKRDMQLRVRERFGELQAEDERIGRNAASTTAAAAAVPWYVIDAARSIEEIQLEINGIVEKTITKVQEEDNKPIQLLWEHKKKENQNQQEEQRQPQHQHERDDDDANEKMENDDTNDEKKSNNDPTSTTDSTTSNKRRRVD